MRLPSPSTAGSFAAPLCLWFTLLGGHALAQEDKVKLKDAPERPLLVAQCSGCHSLDYIPMNAPFLDRKGWEAEVTKMIKVMGAAVADKDLPPILGYLTTNYGK